MKAHHLLIALVYCCQEVEAFSKSGQTIPLFVSPTKRNAGRQYAVKVSSDVELQQDQMYPSSPIAPKPLRPTKLDT